MTTPRADIPFHFIRGLDPEVQRQIELNFLTLGEHVDTKHQAFLVVADDGSGDYVSVKDAVDAVVANATSAVTAAIYVKPPVLTPYYIDTGRGVISTRYDSGTSLHIFGPNLGDNGNKGLGASGGVVWEFDGFTQSAGDGSSNDSIVLQNLTIVAPAILIAGSGGNRMHLSLVNSLLYGAITDYGYNENAQLVLDSSDVQQPIFRTSLTVTLWARNCTLHKGWMDSGQTLTIDRGFVVEESTVEEQVDTTIAHGIQNGDMHFARNTWVRAGGDSALTVNPNAVASYSWSDNQDHNLGSGRNTTTWVIATGDGTPYLSFQGNNCPTWILDIEPAANPRGLILTGLYHSVVLGTAVAGTLGSVECTMDNTGGYTALNIKGNGNVMTLSLGSMTGGGSTGVNISGNNNTVLGYISGATTPSVDTGTNNHINSLSDPSAISRTDYTFIANLKGQQGEPGEPGEDGFGYPGQQGNPGQAGLQGLAGPQGSPMPGEQGEPGEDGFAYGPGAVGQQGPPGSGGPPGEPGEDATDWWPGPVGNPGPPTTVPIAEADVTGLVADLLLKAPLASPALTGHPTGVTESPLDNSTRLASTAYTDAAVAANILSFNTKPDVAYVAVAALPANTYANGASGVGATLTGNVNGPLVIDGQTLVAGQVGERVLITAEAAPANDGWYTITTIGVVAVSKYVLTRAVESDQAAEIGSGYLTGVVAPNTVVPGTNNGTLWLSVAAADPFVVGTTSLTFSKVGSAYTASTGLTLTGQAFSIDTGTTVDKTTAQTLANKTLTAPVLNSPTGLVAGDIPSLAESKITNLVANLASLLTICTSSTRPGSPAIGDEIFETDTGKRLSWYGTTPAWYLPWGVAWGLMGYAQNSSDQTLTTLVDVTGLTQTLTYIANRRIKMTWALLGQSSVSGDTVVSLLVDPGGTTLEQANALCTPANGAISVGNSVITTPAAGSQNYKIRAQRSAASTGTITIRGTTASLRAQFWIEDIGPNGAPV